MKKLVLLALLLFPALASAQIPSGYVQATATVPILANGYFGAAWTNLSSSPQLGLLGCVSTFQTTVNGTIDSYGKFSVLLADPGQICPSPSTWTFTFTCFTPPGAFITPITVTGGGSIDDISSQILAAAPTNICQGGGGGGGLNSFTSGNLVPLFITSLGSDPTHNPALTFTLDTTPNATFLANFSGSTAPWAQWALAAGANVTFGINTGTKTLTLNSTGGSGGCTTSGIVNQAQGADGSGGCSPEDVQVNGVNLALRNLPNFIDGVGTTVVNPSANQIRIDIAPTPVPIEMAPVVTTPGNYVVLYPSSRSGVSGTAGFCPDQGNWNMILNGASGLIVGATCSQTMSGPWKTATGQTLATLGIATSSVSSVQAFAYTAMFPGYYDDGSGVVVASRTLSCGGAALLAAPIEYGITQVTVGTSITGSGIAGTTCTQNLTRNSSIGNSSSTASMDVPSLGLIVFYSGTPVTQTNTIKVAKPLTYDPLTMALGLDPLFPQILFPTTVAQLPAALSNIGSEVNVTDSTSSFGCSTGGGTNFVTCIATISGWVAKQSLVASIEAVNLEGGNLGSIPYQTAPNITAFVPSPTTLGHTYAMGWIPAAQPQIVQSKSCFSGACTFTSPVTSGDLVVAVINDRFPTPVNCGVSDTFGTAYTLQQTTAFGTQSFTGPLTSSGVNAIIPTGADATRCGLLIVEVSGVNASPVDVAGAIAGTTGASVSPSVTTTGTNDLILLWETAASGSVTISLSPSAAFLAGTGLGPAATPQNIWSIPAPTAATYTSTLGQSPAGAVLLGGMIAFKAGSGGRIAPQAIDLTATVAGVASLNSLTGALSLTSTGGTITITPSGSTINLEATGGGGSGITGATAGQALIAGSPTTATSSKALAGVGAGLTTGPTTSTLHDCPWFTDTSGTLGDSGAVCGSGGGLSGMTSGQVPIAATATTVTSSKPLSGGGTGIVTGPNSGTTIGDCAVFASTTGQIGDAGPCPGGGGGGSTVASAEVVSFSATPTFSTAFNVSRIVLTGNITTFTMSAGLDGQSKTLCFKQGTGPYTVTPPANVHGFFTIGTTNALWNCQSYVYDLTDSIWTSVSLGVINE